MSDQLKLWHQEHANFARLLNLLDAQVQLFHAGEQPDYGLMSEIISYMVDYADAYHHPREDAGFARLVQKDPAAKLVVNRLLQEHRVIGAAGRELLDRLRQIGSDAMVPRGVVESAAATYLVYYRHHIGVEESDALQRVARAFSAQDWADLATALSAGEDPLHGKYGEPRFASLRMHLARA